MAVAAVALSLALDPEGGRAWAEALLQQAERPAWARKTAERHRAMSCEKAQAYQTGESPYGGAFASAW